MKICHVNGGTSLDGYRKELAAFEALGAELKVCSAKTLDELKAEAYDADIILFTATKFDNEVFDALPNLKLMVRYGIGYDTVDCAAAKAHGVVVCNSPTYGAYDVAEHGFALLQAANRKIAGYDRKARGLEPASSYPSYRLIGKQIGFVGYGRIARWMATFAKGFGMSIAAYDPYADFENAEPKAVKMTLEEVLSTSDFVSLNTALTDETRGLMNAERFALMKQDAVLVNTSRGGLVDDDALYDALTTGKIRAAGIDVWNEIPKAGNRFCELGNVVITPHVAWNTVEAAAALKDEVIDTVTKWIKGETLYNIVNK